MFNQVIETFRQLNEEVDIQPFSLKGLNLPAIIRGSYRFFSAHLVQRGTDVVFAIAGENFDVFTLQKHCELLRHTLAKPLILVFERLGTRERERLMKRRIQFLVPGSFIYAPALGVSGVMARSSRKVETLLQKQELSGWAETLVIKRLVDDKMEGMSGIEMARLFQVSPIIISQSLRELENHELCTYDRQGKAKRVHFGAKQELWNKASKRLVSPVVGVAGIGQPTAGFVRAGETALAQYSMLADAPEQIFAVGKREFARLRREGVITAELLADEQNTLQLWRRDPRLLAQDGFVDQVSLYLSLKDTADERVQLEAERIMEDLGIKVSHAA